MPILIKDYNWSQTEEWIIIVIPLKGVCLKNIDVFTTDNYLKIHSPPFMFEICLWQPVMETESNCTLANDKAVFHLRKRKAEIWPSLAAELTRQEALEVKQKAIQEAQARSECRRQEGSAKKQEQQRAAVREQINLNTQEQEDIKQMKELERAAALANLGWNSLQSSVKVTEICDTSEKTPLYKNKGKEIWKEAGAEKSRIVAGPRQSASISVSFTPRIFPTPCRESKAAEEQEWLNRQAEARRRSGFVVENLRPEELDPIWLCEKAQSFYDVGNYLGAVSAYTHALTLNNRLYELYAGRGVAQLALGNLHAALSDSSKALELLTPPVPQNAEARARCLLCRGSALTALGLRLEALGELRAAEGLKPNCPDIKAAITQVEDIANIS